LKGGASVSTQDIIIVDEWFIDEDISRQALRRSLRIHKRQRGLPKAKGGLHRGEDAVTGGKARP